MKPVADTHQLEALFLNSPHWIDVRAPIEFEGGAIPGAVNLPLLTNEERHEIGLTYKHSGQANAIVLGHKLVGGAIREARTELWLSELKKYPQAMIYCFRGGLRSQTVQSWLHESGVDVRIIEGGYKALRRFLLESLQQSVSRLNFTVVSGPTGSGKTHYLCRSGRPYLDLERLACHRGSVFGQLETPQPCQADFENALAVELLKLSKQSQSILIEDESRMIGRCAIPEHLFLKMQESPKTLVELDFDQRVENIFADYILNSSLGRRQDTGKFEEFREAVGKISRKLGGLRTQEILHDLNSSEREFLVSQNLKSNRIWIAKLLEWYYDPLYRRSRKDREKNGI